MINARKSFRQSPTVADCRRYCLFSLESFGTGRRCLRFLLMMLHNLEGTRSVTFFFIISIVRFLDACRVPTTFAFSLIFFWLPFSRELSSRKRSTACRIQTIDPHRAHRWTKTKSQTFYRLQMVSIFRRQIHNLTFPLLPEHRTRAFVCIRKRSHFGFRFSNRNLPGVRYFTAPLTFDSITKVRHTIDPPTFARILNIFFFFLTQKNTVLFYAGN